MKRPLAPVALFYVAGILLGNAVPGQPGVLLAATAAFVVLALVLKRERPSLLAASLLLLGWTQQSLDDAVLSPCDLRAIAGESSELVTLRGRLTSTPEERITEDPSGKRPRKVHSQAVVRVSALRWKGGWQPAAGTVLATLRDSFDREFYGGREVEVFGVLRQPPRAVAPGLFDYRSYLAREGIHYQLQTTSMVDWRLLDARSPPRRPLADRFASWATEVLAMDLPASESQQAGGLVDEPFDLLRAMTLGWKTPLTDPVSRPFMKTGTMHIFAISGLHIALVSGILVNLLRAVRIPRAACGAVVIPAIWFYTAATGWQASAVRSTLMMTVVLVGWSIHRPLDLINSLAAAALALLVGSPSQLFQAGFQLSFAVVLSIAIFQPPLAALRDRWMRRDPLAVDVPRSWWRKRAADALQWVATSLTVSLAAWVGSAALIAHYFHLFTPVGLLANLVVVPLSSLALMCNLGALCCGHGLPWLTALFNHSAWFWMKSMMVFSDWAESLPGAWFHVRSLSPVELALAHGVLLLPFVWAGMSLMRRRAAVAMLGCLCVAWLAELRSDAARTGITVLPVGSGMAVHCDEPGVANDLLVDCGSARAAAFVVEPFLRSLGINRLGNILLSHTGLRHVEGLCVLRKEFTIGRVWTPPSPSPSRTLKAALAQLDPDRVVVKPVLGSDALAGWRVLHPGAEDRFPQADDRSVVLFKRIDGIRILMLSDLGRRGQRAFLERNPGLKAEVVIAGMPSGAEPLAADLLAQLSPRIVVLSAGEFPVAQRPQAILLARLHWAGAEVFSTLEDGAVMMELTARGGLIRSMSGRVSEVPACRDH